MYRYVHVQVRSVTGLFMYRYVHVRVHGTNLKYGIIDFHYLTIVFFTFQTIDLSIIKLPSLKKPTIYRYRSMKLNYWTNEYRLKKILSSAHHCAPHGPVCTGQIPAYFIGYTWICRLLKCAAILIYPTNPWPFQYYISLNCLEIPDLIAALHT